VLALKERRVGYYPGGLFAAVANVDENSSLSEILTDFLPKEDQNSV